MSPSAHSKNTTLDYPPMQIRFRIIENDNHSRSAIFQDNMDTACPRDDPPLPEPVIPIMGGPIRVPPSTLTLHADTTDMTTQHISLTPLLNQNRPISLISYQMGSPSGGLTAPLLNGRPHASNVPVSSGIWPKQVGTPDGPLDSLPPPVWSPPKWVRLNL